MGGFEYTGGLWGYEKERAEDEYERRTQMRKNFRSPGEQTLSELGEGRGEQLSSPYNYDANGTNAKDRTVWPWICGETAREDQGGIWGGSSDEPGTGIMSVLYPVQHIRHSSTTYFKVYISDSQ